ncbi:uncharacterized protein LOC125237445 [Leguminivora glycinivorella]|uniref:uncharacterized protein LOC125237445 n=1 Tax=Leguminivora glycinivorella TaxID=1035111 RepID=UPI00200DF896|nr:uncharacterized protein LOC125237445 [Leguminivora glycinivorella]XP_048000476.1 uncharacterized protein LOC125237445 [Leguminivora glycinivorella]
MSVLNQSGEEQVECPLCMEPLEVDDLHFYPCTCGYQICRFCWNRIREGENGLCPACRKAYPENPADFTPLSQEQVAAIKTEKKAREQKRRNKTLESRRALANVRVVQNNLVFVVGLPVRLADPEILKRQEYFGKYGKIHKVVINQSTTYAGSQGPSASAYVTYVSSADALRAIQGVNNVALDGRVLKGSLGTTKYCANFMKNQPCPKPDCMYLHELGDPKASFTKEEMHAGLHQVYERKLHNQLLQQGNKPDEKHSAGNSSTNAEKNGSKEGNPSNFIPTTVVTSSNINVVSSSKSKKESVNGSNGIEASNSNGVNGNGKEAWPSLGSSPPSESPVGKQSSPKPQAQVKSQENGTSESSSPTQMQPAQTKSKDLSDSKTNRTHKDSTNGQPKKSKSDQKNKKHSIQTQDTDPEPQPSITQSSVFENDSQNYLTNDLDELESDRHSLLENHDLLHSSDHSLLEDDTHNLLNDVNNEMMLHKQREMLAGLVDNHMINPMKPLNGYGLIDRDAMSYISNDRHSQISQGLMEKELLLRERSRSEMLMRQNEMLARQHMEPKHYLQGNIGLDSNSELLGANYHPNPNMLPFGMRVEHASPLQNNMQNNMQNMQNSMQNTMHNSLQNSMQNTMQNSLQNSLQNTMQNSLQNMNSLQNSMQNSLQNMQSSLQNSLQNSMQNSLQNNMHYVMHNPHAGPVPNGFEAPQSSSEGRYLAENMDKFFTDFYKTQQMRLLLARAPEHPRQMALEHEHKQRMNNMRMGSEAPRAAGDGDDDLDFDPFKETQKALAEMMETEMMQNTSGDNMELVRRSRLPPPGFALPAHHQHQHQHQHQHAQPQHPMHTGFNNTSASYSDWTQMDPAIMSTSVNFGKPPPVPSGAGQQELWARFNSLAVAPAPASKLPPGWGKLGWGALAPPLGNIPLPPGFSPAKPPHPAHSAHPAECIDAN